MGTVATNHRSVAPARGNTVHLMVLIAFLMLMAGSGLAWQGRSGKSLIFPFTPRGLRRMHLETTRPCRTSSSTLLGNALLC